MKVLVQVLGMVALTVVALVCGVYVGRKAAPAAVEEADAHGGHAHGEDGHSHGDDGHSHGEDDHAHEGELSDATLRNLGVTLGSLRKSSYVKTLPVAAVVAPMPGTEQPVFAPIGGRVDAILVSRGEVVAPGTPLVSLVREPLPRPRLTLTAEILKPAQEGLHHTVLELRRSAEEVRIAQTELERIEQYTSHVGELELPILPRQREIDLRYQLSRSETAYEQARFELIKHGLSDEQITDLQKGEHLPAPGEEIWKRALARNGLWTDSAEQLSRALPEPLHELAWVTATIGELAASGLISDELLEWVSGDADAAAHFLDLGVLLQRGHTIADLKRLHRLGAFEPVVVVRAPDHAAAGWDVRDVHVRPGAAVADGAELLELRDSSRLYLRSDPVGAEVAALTEAAGSQSEVRAVPLVPGTAPDLDGLHVRYVEGSAANGGAAAYLEVENVPLVESEGLHGERLRTWSVRIGQRYVLQVPRDVVPDVYVLPVTALTRDGADEVLFVKQGREFRPVPVEVVHRDSENAVIAAAGNALLIPGDDVAWTGAFQLGLALKGGGEAVGHGHSH